MRLALSIAGLMLMAAPGWGQLPPYELSPSVDLCREIATSLIIVDCEPANTWGGLVGRALYGPLTYAGPIRVSVEARPFPLSEGFPLYVEVRNNYGDYSCSFLPGTIVWETYGTTSCHPDSLWVTSPWLDVPWFDVGTTYWVQLLGLAAIPFHEGSSLQSRESPAIRRVRVESQVTAVRTTTWNIVKSLYRD